MPDNQDYFYVGSLIKIHGIKGEFKVSFDADDISNYLNKQIFFIQKHGTYHAFHVQYIKPFHNFYILKFEEINERTTAEAYLSSSLYLPIEELPVLENNSQFYFHEIIGAKVIDDFYGETGTVKEVLEMPAQDLIVIIFQNKEILLPITDETTYRWDKENQILYTRFPNGLREIYLG